jgi:hypothetical protein
MRRALVSILAGVVVAAACGDHGSNFGDAGSDAGDDLTVADAPNLDGPNFGDVVGNDGNCPRGCSSDLHDVIDCNDNVIQTCSGTDGCDVTTGTCINACQAAVDNKNSVGCEYYATDLHSDDGAGVCYAVFVANTWNTAAHITVEWAGSPLAVQNFALLPQGSGKTLTYAPYNATNGLQPNDVVILFLGGNMGSAPSCSVSGISATAKGTTPMMTTTGIGNSFHITTDVPVVAYQISPYGSGNVAVTGASLLIPVSAWDTNYVAMTASAETLYTGPEINIIAAEDNTQVSILPKVALVGGGGVPSGAANTQVSFTLNKGQQANIEQNADLTGSIIQSSAPVGLMAGNPCQRTPTGTSYCDHGEQMIPPIRALGSEYVGVMYRSRTGEPAIWRMVGAVDGTQLTYSTAITGAPATLSQGQMVEFVTSTPFVVSSQDDQHPFLLVEYMSGSQWSQMKDLSGYGDPDLSIVIPPAQYLSHYVFMTDPTYPETNLVVVRRPDANDNFQDVNLDCAGNLTGWQTVGKYQYTRVDLQTGDFQNVGNCSNGRHEMTSAAPFGLWVWGWGTPNTSSFTANVSYAYPGGMNVQPINTVVVPPTPH